MILHRISFKHNKLQKKRILKMQKERIEMKEVRRRENKKRSKNTELNKRLLKN